VTAYTVPLQAIPQVVSVTLNGVGYWLNVYWNDVLGYWSLDLMDSGRNLLVGGIPLVTGRNLLAPYGYLGIGGQLQVQSNAPGTLDVPGIADLGATGFLYWIPDAS
jgi:hypothetical protein